MQKTTSLTLEQVCGRLQIGRTTATRWMKTGRLVGVKKHRCGAVCSAPATCKQQGAWEFTEASIRAAMQPVQDALDAALNPARKAS